MDAPTRSPAMLTRITCGALVLDAVAADDARTATATVDKDRARYPDALLASIQTAIGRALAAATMTRFGPSVVQLVILLGLAAAPASAAPSKVAWSKCYGRPV